MSSGERPGGPPLAARAVIAAMRAVPAMFTLGWLGARGGVAVDGSTDRAALALALAAIAASYGVRAAVASKRQP